MLVLGATHLHATDPELDVRLPDGRVLEMEDAVREELLVVPAEGAVGSRRDLGDQEGGRVQGTEEAAIHPDLKLSPGTTIISKAMNPDREAYSGFEGTDLTQQLREKGVKQVFVGGLATDYCVKNTVLDALKEGFETVLLTDAVRGVESRDSKRAVKEMVSRGAELGLLG